jgi:hypothetical protein
MADYALVIGIECYETGKARNLQGPGLDAMRFALWLRNRQNLPPKNIILLLNKHRDWSGALGEEYDRTLGEVRSTRIEPREDCSRGAILRAWRTELSQVQERGTLWIYWSGHGLTFPTNRDAVLCADNEANGPAFVYLSELRDSLRTNAFSNFKEQRLIVDACAEYIDPQELQIDGLRGPEEFPIAQSPDQVELSAAPIGAKARAQKGSNLFSRVLLARLQSDGWPEDLAAFYRSLDADIAREVGSLEHRPRLRMPSKFLEIGLERGRNATECKEILEVLSRCGIPFDQYRGAYFDTMSRLPDNTRAITASTVTAIVDELLMLERNELFGGLSEGLVEFACRVCREFKNRADPLDDWLQKKVPAGALSTVHARLDLEKPNLVLTILVQETTFDPSGFPCSIEAHLCDGGFASTMRRWSKGDLGNAAAVEAAAFEILSAAARDAYNSKKFARLMVQVFANPMHLGIPWQHIRIDPEEESVFGERFSFVMRSRARYDRKDIKYDLASWRQKSEALRNRAARDIRFFPVPPSDRDTKGLADIDGLMFLRDTLPFCLPPGSATCQLLAAALRKGLPLAAWRARPTQSPAEAFEDWNTLEEQLTTLFAGCPNLNEAHARLREARTRNAWARDTVLFWDDAKSAEELQNALGEELT